MTDTHEPITEDVVVSRWMMPPKDWGLYAICYMQACAYGETPPERITERANALNPVGDNRWRLIHGDEDYDGVGPNPKELGPVKCADYPARLHWMLVC